MHPDLTPDILISAYRQGVFPMADGDELLWFSPDPRAIIELDAFKPSRSLRSVVRRGTYRTTVNQAFEGVIDACGEREEGTWISADIREAYCLLHRIGVAHSVEAWQDERLAGGLYGVAIGGAFFGESMFSRQSNASKVAIAHLVERMVGRGYALLDVQFTTDHLRSLGATEIPRSVYLARLAGAVDLGCRFDDEPPDLAADCEHE